MCDLEGSVQWYLMRVKPQCVTIQMKAIEQYFPVMLFIMLYQGSSNFLFLWTKTWCVSIGVKAIEQHLHLMLLLCSLYQCRSNFEGYRRKPWLVIIQRALLEVSNHSPLFIGKLTKNVVFLSLKLSSLVTKSSNCSFLLCSFFTPRA